MTPFGWFQRARAPVRDVPNPARGTFAGWLGFRSSLSYQIRAAAATAPMHATVGKCLRKLATSVQTVDWAAVKSDRQAAAATPARAIDGAIARVLEWPNDEQSPAELKNVLAQYLALTGVAYVHVTLDFQGLPLAIYPLSPFRMEDKHNARGDLVGHKFSAGNGEEKVYPTRAVAEAAARARNEVNTSPYVVRFGLPAIDNGCQPTAGSWLNSPLATCGLPMQIVDLLMQRAVDSAGGHPNSKYIVSGKLQWTEPQKADVRNKLNQMEPGGEASGGVAFFGGEDIKVTKLDNDLKDIHSKLPLDDMERRIASAFGIPAALMGLNGADGSKFASNYAESRAAFWDDTIEPVYLVAIEQGLTRAVCRPGWRVEFVRPSASAFQDSIAIRAQRLEQNSIMSIEEKRGAAGLPEKMAAGQEPHAPKASAKPTTEPAATKAATPPTDAPAAPAPVLN